ncbi:hypothetical protein [Desulfocurvibacter africanus]|uniref:Uncharacterized protein n=1 Tax=Desulfocurvibacter africanus subsp. africanus str. Walvis Bay TaxID=690850 RepID=F3Z2U6_DESAF|nr:hypothetical protein [Desulfocurvibacter africanus]EGJ50263.1 hypothetical protein Desaf_1934 [Desulfocurvibacter africanus subsp. africanus str. Walvis Bay]
MIALFSYTVHGRGSTQGDKDSNREELRAKLQKIIDDLSVHSIRIHDTYLAIQADKQKISNLVGAIKLLNGRSEDIGNIDYFVTVHDPVLRAKGNPEFELNQELHSIGVEVQGI